jgi:hypothetical protein
VPPFSGLAFVTFARPETQQQFLKDWGPLGTRGRVSMLPNQEDNDDDSEALAAGHWRVCRAPDHEDIRWEALHVGRCRHTRNML